jgi:hypothetical protein
MRSFYVAAIMPIGGPHSLNFIPILSHTARAARTHVHERTSCKERTGLHLF